MVNTRCTLSENNSPPPQWQNASYSEFANDGTRGRTVMHLCQIYSYKKRIWRQYLLQLINNMR